MFLNPFLAKLPDEARENLCRHMTIQAINRDCTIYKQGEEVSNFYLILSGELSWNAPALFKVGCLAVRLMWLQFLNFKLLLLPPPPPPQSSTSRTVNILVLLLLS